MQAGRGWRARKESWRHFVFPAGSAVAPALLTPLSGLCVTASQASSWSSRFSLSLSLRFSTFASSGGHRQADGAATIDDREMAVTRQHLQGRLRMAPRVAEEVPLRRSAPEPDRRRSSREEGNRRLSDRYDEHHILAEPLVHTADEVLDVMIVE